ncbi:unnamed protein product, partial [Tenebrio molitor]
MRVCGKHFKREEYISSPAESKKPRFKVNAIPSVNLPIKTFSQKINKNSCKGRELRVRKRQVLKEKSDVTNYTSDLCEDDVEANDAGATIEDLCEDERNA